MKGEWEHAICALCWHRKYGNRKPVQVIDADVETCCYCGRQTVAGIYTREDPNVVHPQEG